MSDFLFRADQFRAASLLVSNEEARYYLNGVHIEPNPAGGIFLVATDGHRLGVFHDPEGYAERPAILRCDWKSATLKTKRGEPDRRIVLNGRDATIYAVGNESKLSEVYGAVNNGVPPVDRMLIDEVEGCFPDWRRVVPLDVEPDHSAPLSFDATLLTGIFAAAKILVADREIPVAMFQKAPLEPILIRFPGARDAHFVLMPLRTSSIGSTPDWLRERQPAEKD